VTYVALLNYYIYVLNHTSQCVHVYDAISYQLLTNICDVGDTFFGLASSYTDNCLYIGDRTCRSVSKLEPTDNVVECGHKKQVWPPLEVSPSSLSVSTYDNHNVIVATDGEPCEINEYDKRGVLVRIIKMPSGVLKLHQAVQLRVDYLCRYDDKDGQELGLVNKHGEVLIKFENVRATEIGITPRAMIAVDDDGNILISEENGESVPVNLSKSLKQLYAPISRFNDHKVGLVRSVCAISNSNGYVYTYRIFRLTNETSTMVSIYS